MSPKPTTPSGVRSSKPPATTASALPARILSCASSSEIAAVAHAPTGCTIGPYEPTKDCTACAATTLPSDSCSRSGSRSASSRWSCSSRRTDAMPPIPQPCVFATSAGCTSPSSSSGVTPASANASTVHARFTSPIGSAVASRSAGMPKRARSRPVGQLAGDPAGVRDAARHADLGAGAQLHVPRVRDRVAADAGVLGIGRREGPRELLGSTSMRRSAGSATGASTSSPKRRRSSRRAATARRCGRRRRRRSGRPARPRRPVTGLGVDPAPAVAVALVVREPAQPRELGDRRRRGLAADLEIEAGRAGAARAELAASDDDHELGGIEREIREACVHGRDRGTVGAGRGQRADVGHGLLRGVELGPAARGRGSVAQLLGERSDRRAQVGDRPEPAGEIELHRRLAGPVAQRARPGERAEQPAHLRRRERADPEALLGERGDLVGCGHEPGSANPADPRRDDPHPRTPARMLASPPREQHLEPGLRLGIGAIAAEAAVVRRQGEQDRRCRRALGSGGRDGADEPLHAEQPETQGGLRACAGGRDVAGGRGRGEGRDDRRVQRREPGGERVDVGEGREVRGQDVQLGARSGRQPVELAVPATPFGRVGRRRDDDRRAAAEQPANELSGDRAGARAGDERGLAAQVGPAGQRAVQVRRDGGEQVERAGGVLDVPGARSRAGAPAAGRGSRDRRRPPAARPRAARRSAQQGSGRSARAPGRRHGRRSAAARPRRCLRAARRGRRRRDPSARSPTPTRSARGGGRRSAARPRPRARGRARRRAARAARAPDRAVRGRRAPALPRRRRPRPRRGPVAPPRARARSRARRPSAQRRDRRAHGPRTRSSPPRPRGARARRRAPRAPGASRARAARGRGR